MRSVRDEVARPDGALAGYDLPHGDVVLAGMGLTLAQFDDSAKPQLLFYWPTEAPSSEWLDLDGADGPYELVGWGYIPGLYPVVPEPPEMECIPDQEWFIHEAGVAPEHPRSAC